MQGPAHPQVGRQQSHGQRDFVYGNAQVLGPRFRKPLMMLSRGTCDGRVVMHSTCAVPHVPLSPAKRYTWLASAFRLLGHLHSSLVSWGSGTIRNSGCLSLYRSRRIIPSHGCGSASEFVVGWKQRVAYHVILGTRWRARATETCVGKRSLDINVVDPRGFGTVNCS